MKHSGLRKKSLKKLYQWFSENRRNLPFRDTKDPYRIWVSEVMLQQTRVAAVEEKFLKFIKRFPDIQTLADSSQEEALSFWQGLGYYSRCRNLHKGAQLLCKEYRGRFPGDKNSVLKIPGIGEYTASAVLSIAFGLPHAVLDGNVIRVLSRLYYPLPEGSEILKNLAGDLMEERDTDAGFHNEALMELGALVCKPGKPNCRICPLVSVCGIQKAGIHLALQVPPSRKLQAQEVRLDIFLIQNRKKQILVSRSGSSKFFKNMWFFPHRMTSADAAEINYSDVLLLKNPVWSETAEKLSGEFRHHITRYKIRGNVYYLKLPNAFMSSYKKISYPKNELQFVEESKLKEVVVSSIAGKVMKLLEKEKTASV